MSDIKITVDYSQVGGAISSLGQLQTAGNSLGTAFARNKITQSQYMTAVNQLARSAKGLGMDMDQAKSAIMRKANETRGAIAFTDALSDAEQRLGINTQRSSRQIGRSSTLIQQSGYQIGDFLVQVQSGTNWMVAFGQQATQVAGTLTLLSGKWVMIGSALGVAIPLLTAAGATFMRSRNLGQGFSQSLDRLTEAIEAYSRASQEANRSSRELGEEFGTLRNEVRPILEDLEGINRIRAFEALQTSIEALSLETRGFRGILTGIFVDPIEEARIYARALGVTYEEFQILQGSLTELSRAGSHEEQVEILQSLMRYIRIVAGDTDDMTVQMRTFYEELLQVSSEAHRLSGGFDESNASLEILIRSAMRLNEETTQAATDVYQAFLLADDAAQTLMTRLMTDLGLAFDESVGVGEQLSRLGSLDTSNTTSAIAQITETLGGTIANASTLLAYLRALAAEAPYIPTFGGGAPLSAQPGFLGRMGQSAVGPRYVPSSGAGAPMSGQPGLLGIMGAFAGGPGSVGGGSGGGGGGRSSLEDIINQRMEQIRQERELIGLSEEARRLREISLEIERAYGEELSETQRVAVDTAAQQILAIESVIEAQERQRQMQEDFADTVADSFGDAFMSIIDGTKSAEEAFRDMVANILQELVRLTIINPIMESVRGAVMGGSGGFFGSIGLFGGKATGGYMNPGGAYLVGERGPELVVPGRGSTVTNAQQTADLMNGGGSKSPVFNMTYNFQGGITEQDLGRALPRIVEETKRSVMDSVQRGGATARVFR